MFLSGISQGGRFITSTGKVAATVPYKKFPHIPGLDNIRGYAVLFVLVLHLSYGIIRGGWLGVEIFFVLSGYLITSILQSEYKHFGSLAIRRFYIRRAVRLFPPLLIAIVMANIFWSYNASEFVEANRSLATIASLFYFVNLLPQKISGSLVHMWSLAVEEHFYLFWPFVVSYLFKFSPKKQVIILIVLIGSVSLYRLLQAGFNFQFNSNIIIIDSTRFTFCSIDGILIGALMAVLLPTPAWEKFKFSNRFLTVVTAVMFLITAYMVFKLRGDTFYLNGGFILLDIFCAALIFLSIRNSDNFLFSNKIIQWLGTRSYGIYVYHYVIFVTLEHFRYPNNIVNLILISISRMAISLLFAELSFRFIEQPFSKSKLVSKVKDYFPHIYVTKQ